MDEVINDKNAREQAVFELVKQHCTQGHMNQESESDIVVFEVAHKISTSGRSGGAALFQVMQDRLHLCHYGKLIFVFSGYANDRRELFQIPVVVDFLRGFLFGTDTEPNLHQASIALEMMLNESEHGWKLHGFELTGRNWVVSHALPHIMFFNDKGRIMRNVGRAEKIMEMISLGQEHALKGTGVYGGQYD